MRFTLFLFLTECPQLLEVPLHLPNFRQQQVREKNKLIQVGQTEIKMVY